jgi:hypothetical protein
LGICVVNRPAIVSLARVTRGLSAVFWSLPATLLLDGRAAMGGTPHAYAAVPGLAAAALLIYGLSQLNRFQPQERIWVASVERARIAAWLVFALGPSAAWWRGGGSEAFFTRSVITLIFAGIGLIMAMNVMMNRLAAMLPDATVRGETKLFARVNIALLAVQAAATGAYFLLLTQPHLAPPLAKLYSWLDDSKAGIVLFFAFAPVALTMTLVWKAKEVILQSAFSTLGGPNP